MSDVSDMSNENDNSNGVEFSNRQEQLVDTAIFALVGEGVEGLTDPKAEFAIYSKSESGRALMQSLFNIARENLANADERGETIKEIKQRATAASRDLQKVIGNVDNPVLRRNLEKFRSSKPEEVKRATLDRIRKFLIENPSLLPDLTKSLSGLAIESQEAFEMAHEHMEKCEQERVEQRVTLSDQVALLRTYDATLTMQNNDILRIKDLQEKYQKAISEAELRHTADAEMLNRFQRENETLRNDLTAARQSALSKDNDILGLEQKLQGDQQRYTDTSTLLERSEQTEQELREANQQLNSDLVRANASINTVTSDLNAANCALNQATSDLAAKKEDLNQAIASLNTANFDANLQKEINKSWHEDIVKTRGLNKTLSDDLETARNRTATLEGSETVLQGALTAASAKVATLEEQADAYKERKRGQITILGGLLQAELQKTMNLESDVVGLKKRQIQSNEDIESLQTTISESKRLLDPSNRFASLFIAATDVKRVERPAANANSDRLLAVKTKLDPFHSHPDEVTAVEALLQQLLVLQDRLLFVKQSLDPKNLLGDEVAALADFHQQNSNLRARLAALRLKVDPAGLFPHELEAAGDLHRTIAVLRNSAADIRKKLDPTSAFPDEYSVITHIYHRLSSTRAVLDPSKTFTDEISAANHLQWMLSAVKTKLDPQNTSQDIVTAAGGLHDEVKRLRTEVHDFSIRWPFYYGIAETLFHDIRNTEGWKMQSLEEAWVDASELNASLASSEVSSGLPNYQAVRGLCQKTELQRRSPWEEIAILLGRLHGPTYQLSVGHIEAIADELCHADIDSIRATLLLLYAFIAGRIERRKAVDEQETCGSSLVILRLFEVLSSHITGVKALQLVRNMFERIQPHLATNFPLVRILQESVLLRLLDSKWKVFNLTATRILQQPVASIDDLALTMIGNDLLIFKERTFEYAILRPGQFKLDADILLGWRVCFEDAPLVGTSVTSYWAMADAMTIVQDVFEAYFRMEGVESCLENVAPELELCDRAHSK